MLTASPDAPAPRSNPLGMLIVVGVVALVVYSISVGLGLLGGSVDATKTYLLVALPCLLPTAWNIVGFLMYDSGDIGLLVSGAGWACATSSLFLQYMAVSTALVQDPNALTSGVPVGTATKVLGGIALVLVVAGAVLSWRYFAARGNR